MKHPRVVIGYILLVIGIGMMLIGWTMAPSAENRPILSAMAKGE